MKAQNYLYTFLLDYLGGTYVSQVHAKGQDEAIRKWIVNLDIKDIKGFTNSDKEQIVINDFNDDEPVALNGMHNVWCTTVRTNKGFGVVNFIKTVI